MRVNLCNNPIAALILLHSIPFETFEKEEQHEWMARSLTTLPPEMLCNTWSGMDLSNFSKSITTVPAISAIAAVPVSKM